MITTYPPDTPCRACGSVYCPGRDGDLNACPRWQEAEDRALAGIYLQTVEVDDPATCRPPLTGYDRHLIDTYGGAYPDPETVRIMTQWQSYGEAWGAAIGWQRMRELMSR